jgi:hypothetical protein
VIPPEANATFVYYMEDVLSVYTRPYDPRYPVVCFAETSKQLVKETQVPLPIEPGQPPRYDCEYERNGVSNLSIVKCQLHRPIYCINSLLNLTTRLNLKSMG